MSKEMAKRVIMPLVGVLMAVMLTLVIAPRVAKAQEADNLDAASCMQMADYALVARSLSIQGLEASVKTSVLSRIYNIPAEYRWAFDVVDGMAANATNAANDFAIDLGRNCIAKGGQLRQFLGTGT